MVSLIGHGGLETGNSMIIHISGSNDGTLWPKNRYIMCCFCATGILVIKVLRTGNSLPF